MDSFVDNFMAAACVNASFSGIGHENQVFTPSVAGDHRKKSYNHKILKKKIPKKQTSNNSIFFYIFILLFIAVFLIVGYMNSANNYKNGIHNKIDKKEIYKEYVLPKRRTR